ncbi:MAG: sulfite exporter TauE/SafE family protein [Acidimicrobiales bacterium]|nr:sulfite exporter TauE/SafE family protein [Acidimicrobiales bacterium]
MNWRAIAVSPLGFLIGLSLGTLGGGGSILAVPALVFAAGQNPQEATATSLVLVGVASLVGIAPHWRGGRVRVGLGVAFGLAGVPGSLLGSALNKRMDPDALLLGFSVLILVAAWRMVTGCPTCTKVGEEAALAIGAGPSGSGAAPSAGTAVVVERRVQVERAFAIVAAGTGVGFLTGLFGVGGGFVIVPALTLLLGLSMPVAIGTSLLVIAINSAVALASRLATTTIDWAVTIPFTISAVAGVLVGGRLAGRLDPKKSLRWFAALLVAVAVYTAAKALVGLLG